MKTDGFFRFGRFWFQKFSYGIENDLKLMVMLLLFSFEFFDLLTDQLIGRDHFPEFGKGSHDEHVGLDGTRTV